FTGFLALVPAEFLLELLDAAGGVDELHLAREERMARRADFDVDVLLRAARGELVAAAARHGRFFVLRVNAFFHGLFLALPYVSVNVHSKDRGGENKRRLPSPRGRYRPLAFC